MGCPIFRGEIMKSKTSRRAFLSAGLILPVVSASSRMGLASTGMGLLQPSEGALEKTAAPVKLDYRTLGRTGLKVRPGLARGRRDSYPGPFGPLTTVTGPGRDIYAERPVV